MQRTMLKSKIHRATVIEADLNYIGSITIDKALMRAADILPHELVHVVDITNGSRLQTYAIEGPEHSGMIAINGAAAHLVQPGDLVIIMSYANVNEQDLPQVSPRVIMVNDKNKITHMSRAVTPAEYEIF